MVGKFVKAIPTKGIRIKHSGVFDLDRLYSSIREWIDEKDFRPDIDPLVFSHFLMSTLKGIGLRIAQRTMQRMSHEQIDSLVDYILNGVIVKK